MLVLSDKMKQKNKNKNFWLWDRYCLFIMSNHELTAEVPEELK